MPIKPKTFDNNCMIDKGIVQDSTCEMGPRSRENRSLHLQRAIEEKEFDEQASLLKRINEAGIPDYESTTAAAHKLIRHQISRPSCLDDDFIVHDKSTLCSTSKDVETSFWSHQVKHSKLKGTEQIFARRSGFTNDILDGRIMHIEATEDR